MIRRHLMSVHRFGPCVLDLEARQLTRDGQPTHLSPKAFELLKILITERPKAVSKADLHDRIWPDVFVTDDSLARLVSEVRAAVGDHGRSASHVRTVHGFGYAFGSGAEKAADDIPANTCWLQLDGRIMTLVRGSHVIGRDVSAHVSLASPRVSRRHARVDVGDHDVSLEDLGSRNGTLVNGARISTAVVLADGDTIGVGGFSLTFRTGTQDRPTEAD
jgi:DNA-binding winged helix-turn-helix (wHTH) protein